MAQRDRRNVVWYGRRDAEWGWPRWNRLLMRSCDLVKPVLVHGEEVVSTPPRPYAALRADPNADHHQHFFDPAGYLVVRQMLSSEDTAQLPAADGAGKRTSGER